MTSPNVDEIPLSVFERRREAALGALGEGVLVLPAAPIQHSSRDNERAYEPDRELYYLTGVTEPGSVAVLVGGEEPGLVLFVRDRDAEAELWAGPRLGPDAALERFRPRECYGASELEERLPPLLQNGALIYYRLARGGVVEELVRAALAHARARGGRKGSGPRGVVDPGEILDELRLVKDEVEIARLRRAAEISIAGHHAGVVALCPGRGEWVVEAAIDAAFRSTGARGSAYDTIVGSGANACVLHYVDNASTIGADALVLVDAGADYGLYNGDITRTYPASGRFSGAQREVYDLVEEARRVGIAAVRPGAAITDVHDAAVHMLVDGLLELGVLEGSPDELVDSEAHKPFFPHQTSHWLGLDVHDPGDYAKGGEPRLLEAGMVFTVEPGLYFRPNGPELPPHLVGIGVRIEDDVLVTEDGCEVLTAALPTDASEVEALVDAS
jgi:Xaa-Pro aminopeptidase